MTTPHQPAYEDPTAHQPGPDAAPSDEQRASNEQHGGGEQVDPTAFWEDRYGESDQIWSGRPNARLVEVVSAWTPGRALDLGCGEGGDLIWLAEHGWHALGVDISTTALARAELAAQQRGLQDRVTTQRHDLSATFPEGEFDAVLACFFHTPYEMDRTSVLRKAADAVAAGGHLLIVDHAAPPPWSQHRHHMTFLTSHEVAEQLALGPGWEIERAGAVQREASGPDGETAHLDDHVLVLRRR